jgi:hypothetical protein
MSNSRKSQTGGSQPDFTRPQLAVVDRLVRIAGRVLLWGCVLLLLVRGALSMLDTQSRLPTTTSGVTVTVTQPAGTGTPSAKRR